MSMRKKYLYWCVNIDCSKQIEFKTFKYYNTKLLYITDTKIINKLIPPAEELIMNFEDEEFNEMFENEDETKNQED